MKRKILFLDIDGVLNTPDDWNEGHILFSVLAGMLGAVVYGSIAESTNR